MQFSLKISSSSSFSLSIRSFEPTVSGRVKEGGLRVVAGSKLSPPSARHCTDAVCMYNTSASLVSSVGCSGPSGRPISAPSHHASHKKIFTSSSWPPPTSAWSASKMSSSASLIDDGNKVGGLAVIRGRGDTCFPQCWQIPATAQHRSTSVNIGQQWSTWSNLTCQHLVWW